MSAGLRGLHGDQGVHLNTPEYLAILAERDALKALNKELVDALNKAADTFRDFARADHALGKPIRAAASEVAETATRAVLAKVSP